MAERLDVKESEVVEMQQRLGASDLSVDAPLEDNSDSDLLSVLDVGEASVEDLVADKQQKSLIESAFAEFASSLSERELAIFERRLLGEEKATLNDLSEEFRVSKERIRQVENRLKQKLKDFMLEKLGPAFFSSEYNLK